MEATLKQTPQVWLQEKIAQVKEKCPQFPKYERCETGENPGEYVLIFGRKLRFTEANNLTNMTKVAIVHTDGNRVTVTLPNHAPKADAPVKHVITPPTPSTHDEATLAKAAQKIAASWSASRMPARAKLTAEPIPVRSNGFTREFIVTYTGALLTDAQRNTLAARGLLVVSNTFDDVYPPTFWTFAHLQVTPQRWEDWGLYSDSPGVETEAEETAEAPTPAEETRDEAETSASAEETAPVETSDDAPIPDYVLDGLEYVRDMGTSITNSASAVIDLLNRTGYDDAATWLMEHDGRYYQAADAAFNRAFERTLRDSAVLAILAADAAINDDDTAELPAAPQDEAAALRAQLDVLKAENAAQARDLMDRDITINTLRRDVRSLNQQVESLHAQLDHERKVTTRLMTLNQAQSGMLREATQEAHGADSVDIEDATLFVPVSTAQGVTVTPALRRIRQDGYTVVYQQFVATPDAKTPLALVMRLERQTRADAKTPEDAVGKTPEDAVGKVIGMITPPEDNRRIAAMNEAVSPVAEMLAQSLSGTLFPDAAIAALQGVV